MSDMADKAKLSVGGKDHEYEMIAGSVGPEVIDIRKLYAETGAFTYDPGFTSTASCQSDITYIDGDAGLLLHRGYPIDQLAEQSTFMEVAYLLLNGELPKKEELDRFSYTISRHTMLHEQLATFYRGFRRDAHPMAIMCGVVGALSAFYHDSTDITDPTQRMIASQRLIAKMPTIAAMAYKYSKRQPVRLHRCGDRLPVGPGAWRRQRGGAQHASRDRQREANPGIYRPRQGQGRSVPADGLRPPGLQEFRPAREGDEGHRRRGAEGAQHLRSGARRRQGARANRSQRRLFRREEALSERRFLLGRDPQRDRLPDRHVHRPLRARPHRRLGRAMERDDLRSRPEDRPAAPALHRLAPARLRAGGAAVRPVHLIVSSLRGAEATKQSSGRRSRVGLLRHARNDEGL